jgi:hypothetical protein
VLNRIRSEIPKTTSGITSGASRIPETSPFAKNRRRTNAIAAGTASAVVMIAVSSATSALVFSAFRSSEFRRNSWYQRVVNPSHGNDTISRLLNEKMIRITIGA